MSEISIKVSITNRIYPLKISLAEEENVRKAAKLINDKVKEFEDNYAVRDKQDLLAMCCLQFATAIINNDGKKTGDTVGMEEKLKDIDSLISQYLSQNNVP